MHPPRWSLGQSQRLSWLTADGGEVLHLRDGGGLDLLARRNHFHLRAMLPEVHGQEDQSRPLVHSTGAMSEYMAHVVDRLSL